MIGLRSRENVIRGTCDGRPASLTIIVASHGAPGRLVMRAGPWTREVPSTFLNGSLVTNRIYHTGLACDGQHLQLHATAIRADARGELVMDVQDVVMNLRNGELSIRPLWTRGPEETRSEFR